MRKGSRPMKKLLFLGVGSVVMFTMSGIGTAQADNGPHMGAAKYSTSVTISTVGSDRCATCHRAHTAKAGFLLLQAQPALCYTCHDGTTATTAVAKGEEKTSNLALRGGGFVTAAIGSGLASKSVGALDPATGRATTTLQNIPALPLQATAPVTSSHAIDGNTSGTAWGNGPINGNTGIDATAGKSLTLECGSCHDPHGNGNFRILKPMPTDSQWIVTAAVPAVYDTSSPPVLITAAKKAVMSPATNVNIPDQSGKLYTTDNYWNTGAQNTRLSTPAEIALGSSALTDVAGTGTAAPDGYIENISAWCTTCHTRYLAPTQSYKTALTGTDKAGALNVVDTTFTYRHRSDANYKQGAANCIQCHVSHGSNAAMDSVSGAVTNPDGTTTNLKTADSRLLRVDNRGMCLMCHNV